MAKKEDERPSSKYNLRWVFFISLLTFFLSVAILVITENVVVNLSIAIAFIVLIIIILIGIIFDIIGIAVTTADETPFHAMAANRVEEAKYAIKLVRNAGQVSNFCNDVIGDICGIVSGAAGTTIIYKLMSTYSFINGTIFSILIAASIASLTVGGKAFGKSIAMHNFEKIIYRLAKILNFFEKKFGIHIFPDKNNKK